MRWTVAVLAPLASALSIVLVLQHNLAQLRGSLALSAFLIPGGLFVWFSFRTQFVRVSAEEICAFCLESFLVPTRMPRTDLAYIFRGLTPGGRWYRVWLPAYFLVARADAPRITLSGGGFTENGMAALADRLGVPIKGDFTAQIQ